MFSYDNEYDIYVKTVIYIALGSVLWLYLFSIPYTFEVGTVANFLFDWHVVV